MKPDGRILFRSPDGYDNELKWDQTMQSWYQIRIHQGANNSRRSGPLDPCAYAVLFEEATGKKPKGVKLKRQQLEQLCHTPFEKIPFYLRSIGAYVQDIPQTKIEEDNPEKSASLTSKIMMIIWLTIAATGSIDAISGSPGSKYLFGDKNRVMDQYIKPEHRHLGIDAIIGGSAAILAAKRYLEGRKRK